MKMISKMLSGIFLLCIATTQQACVQAKAQPSTETISDYELVSSDNAWKLQQDVKWKITTGWKTSGGICVADKIFYQAMVR